MKCALHAEAIVDGLGKNYANFQAVVKICQLFVSQLSTVIDSTNQILIPGAGIMERQHQSMESLFAGRIFFQTSLGACSQATTSVGRTLNYFPRVMLEDGNLLNVFLLSVKKKVICHNLFPQQLAQLVHKKDKLPCFQLLSTYRDSDLLDGQTVIPYMNCSGRFQDPYF